MQPRFVGLCARGSISVNSLRTLGFVLTLTVACRACAGFDIQFDYRYDTRGFFSGENSERRQVLEAAASTIEERIRSTPPAILPSGNNTWTLSFPNPDSGDTERLRDLRVPEGVMLVFVGAQELRQGLLAYAEFNYTYLGDNSWVELFEGKDNETNFSAFGGAISFDVDSPWFFDDTPETPDSFPDQYDFYSLALHELGHLLGFTDGSQAFDALTRSSRFYGDQAQALYGGPVPLASGSNHWRQDVQSNGLPACMTPNFSRGQRKPFTELDFAALADLGYVVEPPIEPLVLTGITIADNQMTVTWEGGLAPFQLQARSELTADTWVPHGSPTSEQSLVIEASGETVFLRVQDAR